MPPKYEQQEGSHPVGDTPPGKTGESAAKTEEGGYYNKKYRDIPTFEAAHKSLESKLTEQGSELGSLRKENRELSSKLMNLIDTLATNPPRGAASQGDQTPDFEQEFTAVEEKVQSGDMSIAEALRETRRITTAEAMQSATRVVQEMSTERDAEGAKNAFLQQYPDYVDVVESGALDPIMEKNGVLDTVAAYFVYKANQATADREAAIQQAYDKGKAEQAKAEAGVKNTQQVLDGSGTEIAKVNKPTGPMTSSQLEDSMLGAIRNLRATQGA